jgi:hypothetical protein
MTKIEMQRLLEAEDHLTDAMRALTSAAYVTTAETPEQTAEQVRFLSAILARIGVELGTLRNYMIERSGRTIGNVIQIRPGLSKEQEAEEAKLRG